MLQVLTALSGLVASGSAQAAAAQAGQAAEAAGTASGDAAAPFPQPPSG